MRSMAMLGLMSATFACDACPPLDRAAAAPPPRTIADVVEMSSRGVVNISTNRLVSVHRRDSRSERDLFFRFFFGLPDEPEQTMEQTEGSAVVVSSDGLAITNHHLIKEAVELHATTASGEKLEAEVVGVDPETDLALIRLQGNLQSVAPFRFGDSDALRPGEVVVAIGNSFGLGQTVSAGVVSGKGRSNLGIVAYEDFIQTDSAINPGNSGGALLDLRGDLVGINTALLTETGMFEGVGLAIPSNLARTVMVSLRDRGRMVRGYLGATALDVDEKLARALHFPSTTGALVSNVEPGGPAALAGLEPADLVAAIDGEPVSSARHLRAIVDDKVPNKPVVLEVHRDGAVLRFAVTPTERPAPPRPSIEPIRIHRTAGVEGWRLDADSSEMLGVPKAFTTGVVVAKVLAGSPAWFAGLRPGDVIVSAGKQTIESTEALDRAYLASEQPILMRVVRRGIATYLVLEPKGATPAS